MPYAGVIATGPPVGTFVNGRKVMWEGDLTGSAQGETVSLHETMGRVGAFTGRVAHGCHKWPWPCLRYGAEVPL